MDTELLRARVADLRDSSRKSGAPRFMGFLSAEEAEYVKSMPQYNTSFSFFGGAEDSERVFLCVTPEDLTVSSSAYPISALTFNFRKEDTLTHRDFLGSFMSLGIKRETVGDILTENGRAVAFVSRDVAKYITEQTTRVGRVGVTVLQGFSYPLPQRTEKIKKTITVASSRLDCVVAALINASRARASEILADRLVAVNSVISDKATKVVVGGDKISIRGYGKYNVLSIDGTTRKGRTVLVAERY